MIWFVHRPGGPGTPISWAGHYAQAGYADEQLDDLVSLELQTFLANAAKIAPAKPTPLAWFTRLSQTTQANLAIAARTDVQVDLAMRYASGAVAIDVTDALTIQSVNMLQSKLLLTAAEVAILLAP